MDVHRNARWEGISWVLYEHTLIMLQNCWWCSAGAENVKAQTLLVRWVICLMYNSARMSHQWTTYCIWVSCWALHPIKLSFWFYGRSAIVAVTFPKENQQPWQIMLDTVLSCSLVHQPANPCGDLRRRAPPSQIPVKGNTWLLESSVGDAQARGDAGDSKARGELRGKGRMKSPLLDLVNFST